MPRYDELKVWLQKSVYKKYGKGKKIMPPAGFKPATASQALYRSSCIFQRNVTQVFSTPLPSTHFAFSSLCLQLNSFCRENGSTHELAVTNLELADERFVLGTRAMR